MRAYVMARKGILASDPSLKDMTPTRWMFEYHALVHKEKTYLEAFARILRNVMVSTLGLSALRPEDANGNPKTFEEMSDEEKESFIPLVGWVGRPELLQKVSDQIKKDVDPALVTGDAAYEALVAAIDAADGDMDPIIGIDHIKVPKNPWMEQEKKLANVQDIREMDIEGDA